MRHIMLRARGDQIMTQERRNDARDEEEEKRKGTRIFTDTERTHYLHSGTRNG